MKLKVQTRRTSDLSEDPANLRVHPERSVEAVKASLRRFGLQHPILVDSKCIVRAGNARLRAARELGWETIEVVVSDLPDHELVAYSVADNRTAELSHFDPEALAAQLKAMDPSAEDALSMGFDAEEIARMIASLQPPDAPDAFPDPELGACEHACPRCGYEWNGPARSAVDAATTVGHDGSDGEASL